MSTDKTINNEPTSNTAEQELLACNKQRGENKQQLMLSLLFGYARRNSNGFMECIEIRRDYGSKKTPNLARGC